MPADLYTRCLEPWRISTSLLPDEISLASCSCSKYSVVHNEMWLEIDRTTQGSPLKLTKDLDTLSRS